MKLGVRRLRARRKLTPPKGLRTLLTAKTEKTADENQKLLNVFLEAGASMEGKEVKVRAAVELIEQALVIQGVTAIEDKLQIEVPDALYSLRKAGIKVWMLTGHKVDTAINIGHSWGSPHRRDKDPAPRMRRLKTMGNRQAKAKPTAPPTKRHGAVDEARRPHRERRQTNNWQIHETGIESALLKCSSQSAEHKACYPAHEQRRRQLTIDYKRSLST